VLILAAYRRQEGKVKSGLLPCRGYWYMRHLYYGNGGLHRISMRRHNMEGLASQFDQDTPSGLKVKTVIDIARQHNL